MEIIDFIIHVDKHLEMFLQSYGAWFYVILFLIIFIETGIVVMPFLPGDSLLFAAGMLAAQFSDNLNIYLVLLVLWIAAILGDSCNYLIGHELGNKALSLKLFGRTLIKEEHLNKTHQFYEKYGSTTIIIARFVPIVRTLAPFVAGIGKMHYRTFAVYNIIGGTIWVVLVTLAGYFLGNIPWVKDNFEKIVLGIIVLSILPIVFTFLKEKFSAKS